MEQKSLFHNTYLPLSRSSLQVLELTKDKWTTVSESVTQALRPYQYTDYSLTDGDGFYSER